MRLPGSDKVIVGYDLGKDYAQISCYVTGREEEITTLSSVAGSQVYTIPLVLSKRQGVNQWFYGSEALRHAEEEEGILVEHLLKLAKDGEPVQIDGTTLDPVALLTLFLKRSLGMLSQMTSTERIGALMITCEELDGADAGSGGITPEDGCCLFSEPSGELLLLQSVSAGKSVEAGERAVRV